MVTGRLKQRSWENQEGEKRTVIEIEADDLGPSLKWATASVAEDQPLLASSSSSGGGDWGAAVRAGGRRVVRERGDTAGCLARPGTQPAQTR